MEALQWILSAGANFFEAIQLNNEMERLRASLPKARMLMYRSQWDMSKNTELARLLSLLKETIYDAEDILRDLDDKAQRQSVQDDDLSTAGQLLAFSLNNLGKVFVHRSKTKLKEAQDKLDKVVTEIEGVLNLMGLMSFQPSQIMPQTSLVVGAAEVVGRDDERDVLMEMLGVTLGREAQRDQVIELLGVPLPLTRGQHRRSAGPNNGKRPTTSNDVASTSRAKQPKRKLAETDCNSNVSVIPIVGIGGMGKTTLAQFIYNDRRVVHHFGVRIWVCVSDFFDKIRITREIIESMPGEKSNPSSGSINALQVELMKHLKMSPRFLLVLDDIWPNANDDWEAFYAPLRHGPQGSMILVTTRCPVVATRVATINFEPVQLEGLPADIFWNFFKKCAFGANDAKLYPDLQDIGRSISKRLCRSPLAAKTLGRLLNMSLTEQHWRTIQKSELWELRHKENEILPALQLSYLYLPEEVKRCFVFCSMFPKDYSFKRDEIVGIWVAEGFVAPVGGLQPEDVGISYLNELRNRFLFQADPQVAGETRYVMHDLIHDMAMSFSMDECLVMQDLTRQLKSITQNTVHHMSIEKGCESLARMRNFERLNKLRSLRFANPDHCLEFTSRFSQLSNILFLSLKGFSQISVPESICELHSLRYLDISYSSIQELPRKLGHLDRLQFLDASHSRLRSIHQDVTKLVNLRQLALPAEASQSLSMVSGLGSMSCLRNLSEFTVAKENGRGVGELKFMNQLRGSLCIRSLNCVRSSEEATDARLIEKQYLRELVLHWWPSFLLTHSPMPSDSENEVLEGLRPHLGIECLRVHHFGGDRFPSWFQPEDLPSLRSLELSRCGFMESLSSVSCHAFTRLTALRVYQCLKLTNLEQFLNPETLPYIQSIILERCFNLASMHSFVGFASLRDLKICHCPELLVCPGEMVLPSSLRQLSIVGCSKLDMSSFPACIENLTSLTLLQLVSCHNIKRIPLNSNMQLRCLVMKDCRELSSIGGLQALASIQHAELLNCPKLTEVELPFVKKGPHTEEKKLLEFLGLR